MLARVLERMLVNQKTIVTSLQAAKTAGTIPKKPDAKREKRFHRNALRKGSRASLEKTGASIKSNYPGAVLNGILMARNTSII